MKLGIMQPYFFPYIGYFQLIKAVDKFIFLDTVQFIRHGWIERNRILKINENWLYIKVPLLKHSQKDIISSLKINQNENWQKKIFAQLEVYKKQAPFYLETVDLLMSIFKNAPTESLAYFNFYSTKEICKYLEINTELTLFSKMDLQIDSVSNSGDWALNISKALCAESYINPEGGRHLFDINKFEKERIDLKFLTNKEFIYSQRRNNFESSLSIIDALMFVSKEDINKFIQNGSIE